MKLGLSSEYKIHYKAAGVNTEVSNTFENVNVSVERKG